MKLDCITKKKHTHTNDAHPIVCAPHDNQRNTLTVFLSIEFDSITLNESNRQYRQRKVYRETDNDLSNLVQG